MKVQVRLVAGKPAVTMDARDLTVGEHWENRMSGRNDKP